MTADVSTFLKAYGIGYRASKTKQNKLSVNEGPARAIGWTLGWGRFGLSSNKKTNSDNQQRTEWTEEVLSSLSSEVLQRQ